MRLSLLLLSLLFLSRAGTQVISKRDSLPPNTIVTARYYGGHGGFWSRQFTDDRGRTVREESYRRAQLRGVTLTKFNPWGDEAYQIQSFDINHPARRDTSIISSYEYGPAGRILQQTDRFGYGSLRAYRLAEVHQDTLVYIEHFYREDSLPRSGDTTLQRIHRLVLNDRGRRIYHSESDPSDGSIKRVTYRYDNLGDLARRVIEYEPDPEDVERVYLGGPTADYQKWSYQYDRYGRIRREYTTIANTKILIARYRYRKYQRLPTQYGWIE